MPISRRMSITRVCRRVLDDRVRSMSHQASVVQTTKLGHERWVPENTPVSSETPRGRGKPKSRRVHVCGVNSAFRRSTSKEPPEALRPIRVTVSNGRLHARHVNS